MYNPGSCGLGETIDNKCFRFIAALVNATYPVYCGSLG